MDSQSRTILIAVALFIATTIPAHTQQPWRIYSLFSFDSYENSTVMTLDESISFPLSNQFVIQAGGAWKSEIAGSFFTDPLKTEARLGLIFIQPSWRMYFECYGGLTWIPKDEALSLWESSVQSIFAEGAINWETDFYYIGLRERILFNQNSITSITNVLLFWTPLPYMKISMGMSLGIENDIPMLPGIRAEFITPVITMRPELLRLGIGAAYERFFNESTQLPGNTVAIKAIVASALANFIDIKASVSWSFGDRLVYPLTLELLSAIIIK